MAGPEPLREYRRKRDFRRTPEPRGGRRSAGAPRFVIQKHDASRLHYDFRLEVDGVLKSWAVPKGPSTDPRDKRLAVPTEDHPLSYRDFEGVIPQGEYGGGTVIVWDAGTYRPLTDEPFGEALRRGHAAFWLDGHKLRGGYALERFRTGKDEAWLLVKMKDSEADARRRPVNTQPESVLTGRTVEEVAPGMSTIRIGRRRLEISHPDKVLFPDDGITKADLVEYYRRVARVMVPQVRGAPVMLERYPNGIGAKGFIQKEISGSFPDWVPRVEVPKKGGRLVHALANDAATLAYLAGQGCVTIHTWLSRVPHLDQPYRMIFDLDPSTDRFDWVGDGARALRTLLEELGLVPFLKTTGSRGLHVVVPLDQRAGTDEVRAFANDVASLLAQADPQRFTTEFRKKERGQRVYLDVARNGYAQTAVAPYAVRARKGAPVATPVDWSELDDPHFGPQRFSLFDVPDRLEHTHDPWAGMGRQARSLRRPRRRLDALLRAT